MKALILYPMNALANDQAKRLTELLTTREELADITAALYTGQEGPARTRVTPDGLITDRAIIRDAAPDILLTNYKMLDQLLLRHEDQNLWAQSADSLQYLVLDEFHTYDGAQGTDVAMLLRRLGLALKSHWPEGSHTDEEWRRPLGRITPVATSATLGDQGDPAAMVDFARTVFGDEFDSTCVVFEERLSFEDWRGDASGAVERAGLEERDPTRPDLRVINETLAELDPTDAPASTIALLAELYGTTASDLTAKLDADPGLLPVLVREHSLTKDLVTETASAAHLTRLAEKLFPGASTDADDDRLVFLTHLVAALSHVRATLGRSELTVETHLWVRELTRVDRVASSAAEYRWSDDGPTVASEGDAASALTRPVFPAIYCRHCGRSGWGVELAPVGSDLASDDTSIRRHHATRQGRFRALLYAPLEAEHTGDAPVEGLRWLSVRNRMLLAQPPDEDDRDLREGWVLPVLTQTGEDADDESRADTCPSCQQRDSIRFLGSAIATLVSVTLSTLFGTEGLDPAEKKALVFTDSVQDAAHRAGFVESRSHVLTQRSVLRAAVGDSPIALDALVEEAIRQAGDDRFQRFRLVPPELAERDEFSPFWKVESARDVPPNVATRVRRRLLFDATMEFGLQSRVGRTLEQTGSVAVEVEAGQAAKLAAIARAAIARSEAQDTLDETLASLPDSSLVTWVRGTLEHLRERGGIEHEWFSRYLREDGNRYRIWGGRPRGQGMPAFPKARPAPAFARIGPSLKRKDPLLDPVTSPQSWYARWAARTLGVQPGFGAKLARILFETLAREDVLRAASTDSGGTVYAIPTSSVIVHPTTDADLADGEHLLVCSVCHHQLPGTHQTVEQLDGAPCMLVRCPGTMHRESREPNYYRTLYSSSDMRRIVSREHSSLLDDKTRLEYESGFKQGQTNPDAPNVLVATPTLEMGIDIGDLSTVMLASLPRTVTSYLQRVGRAGRLTGNSLNLAFVTGRGLNLQRLENPLGVINGPVRPPATYLSASEILRRQYLAHLVDHFARDPRRPHPRRADLAMRASGPDSFLAQLVDFAESGSDAHLARFLGGFDSLSESAIDGLRQWATASEGPGTSGLAEQVFAASRLWNQTVEGLARRQKAIEDALPDLELRAGSAAASDEDRRAFRSAQAAVKVTQGELARLRGVYWIAVLEEFGLLPNYTLIDDSVTLEVALTWTDPDSGEYLNESTSVTRASANALREFAPGSTFYARGLEIFIDAVDLGVGESAVRRVAFCPTCGFAADVEVGNSPAAVESCPRCGDRAVAGIEHQLDVVELTRVSSELNRDEAQISDRTEERRQERYSIVVAADIDPERVAEEWYVEDYHFGVKYLSRMDVRWVNAGRSFGPTMEIAGVQQPAPLFRLCEGCGKLDRQTRANVRGEHRPWCRYRNSSDEHVRELALTRSLTTQGAVLRLPLAVTLGDRFAMPSLAAAVSLGLQEQIGGLPDHIEVTPIRVPAASDLGDASVDALLLHDVVPGGTGYLAELASPDRVWDMLHRAWRRVASCPCRGENRLSCHRCLLPFAPPWQIDQVSRAAAERHLREILTAGAEDAQPANEMAWRVTKTEPAVADAESHLEQRFRKVFGERLADLGATVRETPGTWGNTLHITFPNATRTWTLEPQVQLGGVRPDFVLRSSQHTLPKVAIFADGWRYHAVTARNRIADDARKRRDLRAQDTVVLAITWADLERAERRAVDQPPWHNAERLAILMERTASFGPDHAEAVTRGPIDLLLGWIQKPDPDGLAGLANELPWLFAGVGVQVPLVEDEDLAQAAAEEMTAPGSLQLGSRGVPNGWWWRSGGVGVLTRASADNDRVTLHTVALVDDRTDALGHDHRGAWEEWLRLSNLLGLRTQPTQLSAVSEVLAGVGFVTPEPTPADALPPEWRAAIELALGTERELLVDLAALGSVPVPEVGFETYDGISLDVAWPDALVAVDLGVDDDTRKEMTDAGWTWVGPDADAVAAALSGGAG